MEKNILVTGATRGIGKAISTKLRPLGNLFITGRNEDLLKQTDCDAYCVCDLSHQPNILMKFIKDNKINVLVNNAGLYVYNKIEDVSFNEIEQIFHTNLLSPISLIAAAVPTMKENGWGRIINIGSISGVMGEAGASLYSSSKAGLLGATKALALELAEFNITVNTINPGWVDTDLGNSSINDGEFSKEEVLQIIPQRRFVAPDEVANLVKYLISEEAKGITGQGINLCAGLSVGI